MEDNGRSLTPQSGFITTFPKHEAFDQESFDYLYRPILGANAFTLYIGLKDLADDAPQKSERHKHSTLLNWIDLDLKQLLINRRRLEGIGLLNTYYQCDDLGDFYLYQMKPPLSAKDFFKNPLLELLLEDIVGVDKVAELKKYLVDSTIDHSGMSNITANLLSIFHINKNKLANKQKKIIYETNNLISDENDENQDFDFDTFLCYLDLNYINKKSVVNNKQLILAEHKLYGFSEKMLASLVMQCINLDNNNLDELQLKKLVINTYSNQMLNSSHVTEANVEIHKNNFSDQEQKLIEAFKYYTPIDFLIKLKKKRNQFVTDEEQLVLQNFVKRNVLSNSVINVLIYYLINDREQNVLNKNSLNKVANDWLSHGIRFPEDAIVHMKQHNSQRQQYKSVYRSKTVREKMPNWNEQKVDQDKVKVNKKRIDQLKKELAKKKHERNK